MKKNILILFSILLIFFYDSKPIYLSLKEKEQQKLLIESFLNDWHLAASKANYAEYFDKMANNSVFIGTDASEIW